MIAAMLMAAAPAAAQTGSLRGMITARDGDKMVVTTSDGANHTFMLTPNTKVVQTEGALGIRQSELSASHLLNGLPVTVESVTSGDQPEATKVTFKSGDLKTAQQVEAGTAQVKEAAKQKLAEANAKTAEVDAKAEALKKRLSEANQYVSKGETTVYFATGSIALDAKSKTNLQTICDQAKTIKGYMIGVTGHADSTGDAHANQVLSEKRANAVIRHMQKTCGIQPYRVLAQNAMGEDKPTAISSHPTDLAQNRRVVVQILTNKGLEGL
jgi:outer membrane protein OmpA-like peptidoglycan-associated protein